MKKNSPFIIYDAAAGSGKTFTLVKEYLKIILQEKTSGYYKYILAITFTNKAVAEMKQRIISNLTNFSLTTSIENPSDMALQIVEETGLSNAAIQAKSKKILKHILHHYSSFSVETIDSFNHRIIRTFARDLHLSGNFEVSLDIPKLTSEAVDQLLSKAGNDSKITQVLLDFALEKIDDDKSWDISKDIVKTSGLLFNENDREQIEMLKEKSLDDFINFRKQLKEKRKAFETEISKSAEDVLQKITSEGILPEQFLRKTLPNHFLKIKEGNYDVYKNKLQENLEAGGNTLYKVKTDIEVSSKIDAITPFLLHQYTKIKSKVFQLQLFESLLKNINPLSVINLVNQEINTIKEEQNILPITEFNQLINKEIKNQPTPFIYERLGERYRHYFIDEFQDTSLLQWQNMIPLIDNAISQKYQNGNQGSLLLVGDAKQSIYRWRGGLPEQFIELCNAKNPFHIEKELLHLPTNYRSCKEIIDFNNEFFTFTANYFGNIDHKNLYISGNQQSSTKKNGGYVKFEFIDTKNKQESHEVYAEKVLETIKELLKNGCREKDICILTRKRKDGITLGTFLLENGITIISSETLLLQHSPVVQFLINCLIVSVFPENEEVKINLLEFLYEKLSVPEEKHTFFSALLKTSFEEFSSLLGNYGIDFSFNEIQSLSLYDSFEYCIRKFKLDSDADAYLIGLMDLVYEYEQKPKANKVGFLEDWELQKEKAGIPVSESAEGVQLMTIHKAKGLEFPVVLFPYADLNIYDELEPKSWYPLNEEELEFKKSLVNFNSNVQEYGEIGKKIYQKRRNTLELDNLNLLYVTLTRAEVQLYIFSEFPSKIKEGNPTTFNQFFGEFLKHKGLWEEGKEVYEIGMPQLQLSNKKEDQISSINSRFISTSPQDHNLNIISRDALLWDTEKEEAITSGNILHNIMEKIKHEDDLDVAFKDLDSNNEITKEEIQSLKEMISNIVSHPKLNSFFNSSEKVLNEKKIITSQGEIHIPDRLNFHKDNSVTIIDYKTGALKNSHKSQISNYAAALNEMGYLVLEKILIYCSSEGILINKV